MKLRAFLCVFILSCASAEIRQISSKLNPGCYNCNSTVVYVNASGQNDVLHQVWDFSRGIPTVIFFISGLNSTLNIIWDGSVPKSFELSETPRYSFALALESIIEYDDVDDKAQFDVNYRHRYIPLNIFSQHRTASLLGNDKDAMVLMHHTKAFWIHQQTTIEFRVETSTNQLASDLLPHLLFTPNASIIDISLSGLPTSRDFRHSRFAARFVLVSSESSADSMYYAVEKRIDDEHAPGVFEMIYLRTPESYKSQYSDGGYVQLRPVAYRAYKRTMATATGVKVSSFTSVQLPSDSTMSRFYGNNSMFPEDKLLVQDVFISFGDPGDGFYKQYNVTAWEMSMGMGPAPAERVSPAVLAVLGVGLALPALLAAGGVGAVLLCRRRRGPRLLVD